MSNIDVRGNTLNGLLRGNHFKHKGKNTVVIPLGP